MNNVLTTFVQRVIKIINEFNALGYRPTAIRVSSRTIETLKSASVIKMTELPETLLGLPVYPMKPTTKPKTPNQICGLLVVVGDTVDEMEFMMDAEHIGYCSRIQPLRITSLT